MFQAYCLGILLCVASSLAFYDSSSDVVELTPANFDKLVTNSDDVWLVEFYAPWCGHCKNLVPEYKKAARALKGIVHVGAVDADQHKSLGSQFGISGFPTIKIFKGSKHTPFSGQRTAQSFVDAAISAAKDKAFERLGAKPSDSGKGFGHNIPWKSRARHGRHGHKKKHAKEAPKKYSKKPVKWNTPKKAVLRKPVLSGLSSNNTKNFNKTTKTKKVQAKSKVKKALKFKSHLRSKRNKKLQQLQDLQAHLFRRNLDSDIPKIIKYQSVIFNENKPIVDAP